MTTATKTTTNAQLQKQLQEMGMELAAMKEQNDQKENEELKRKDEELSSLRAEVSELKEIMIHMKPSQPEMSSEDYLMPAQTVDLDDIDRARQRDETIIEPPSQSWAEDEAFLNEMVKIHVAPAPYESNTSYSQTTIDLSVNGKPMLLECGMEYTLPRRYVQALARSKKARYVQTESEEQYNRGLNRMVYSRQSINRFPFSVIQDTDKGRAWLKGIYSSES